MKATDERKAEALTTLRKVLKIGDTVYTVLNNVSRSGMSREITLYTIGDDKQPMYLSGYAEALGLGKRGKQDGNRVSGCSMDMGFHLVYELSYNIFPDGHECIGKNCPSNDHFNGDRNYEPHKHNDGGYALKHKWL